jgi:hypothetical protein
MEDKKFQAAAILTSVSYTKDGGVRLGFTTNEMSDEDKLIIAKFFQKFGFVLFKSNEFTLEDIPLEDAEDKTKTPSKRLRAVLFLMWKQAGQKGDFEVYYRAQVEKVIEHLKAKLD